MIIGLTDENFGNFNLKPNGNRYRPHFLGATKANTKKTKKEKQRANELEVSESDCVDVWFFGKEIKKMKKKMRTKIRIQLKKKQLKRKFLFN